MAERGASNFAPIFDFGLDQRGAWCAMEFYRRGSLHKWVGLLRQGGAEVVHDAINWAVMNSWHKILLCLSNNVLQRLQRLLGGFA